MITGESNGPALVLTEAELRKIYWLIRYRQDDCRKVTPEYDGYEALHALDLELACLNDKVAKQIQVVAGK